MKEFRKDVEKFIGNRWYVIFVLLLSVICYGYAANHMAVSIDDLRGAYYAKAALWNGRFAATLLKRVIGFFPSGPILSYAIDA